MQEESNLEVAMLSSGVSLLYSFFMANQKRQERMDKEYVIAVDKCFCLVNKRLVEITGRNSIFAYVMFAKNSCLQCEIDSGGSNTKETR